MVVVGEDERLSHRNLFTRGGRVYRARRSISLLIHHMQFIDHPTNQFDTLMCDLPCYLWYHLVDIYRHLSNLVYRTTPCWIQSAKNRAISTCRQTICFYRFIVFIHTTCTSQKTKFAGLISLQVLQLNTRAFMRISSHFEQSQPGSLGHSCEMWKRPCCDLAKWRLFRDPPLKQPRWNPYFLFSLHLDTLLHTYTSCLWDQVCMQYSCVIHWALQLTQVSSTSLFQSAAHLSVIWSLSMPPADLV